MLKAKRKTIDHVTQGNATSRGLRFAAAFVGVCCVVALTMGPLALGQAPHWMLPLGAKVQTREASEVVSGQARSGQQDSLPKPARLPDIARPTRLPIPGPELPVPRQAVAARPYANLALLAPPPAISLLAPQIEEQTSGDPTPVTSFDPIAFENSVEASIVTWRRPELRLDFAATAQCDSAASIPCGPSACIHEYYSDFSPTPVAEESIYANPCCEEWVYDSKRDVPTQHPWVEWGRVFYGDGITPRGKNWFGEKNMARPEFYVYGDYRSGIATGRNNGGRIDNWANRLNLDMDLQLTDTERFHAFAGPLDNDGQFTRWELVDGDFRYRNEMDLNLATGYFEGDLGVLLGAAQDRTSPFELPFTIGLVPLLFQNGIWMEDAVTGAAFSLPARHSRLLNWSNYDATFFAVVDQLNSPAFGSNEHAAQAFGTAWFIEAYHGYIETGYAYVRDRNRSELSYHNITASYTRRYFDRISNSMRVIINTGQDLPDVARTADGVLLLCENSWITSAPLTVVPYANLFVGWDRPQSVARAGVSGGILRNTGINFETDGLNGFPTLDPTGSDTAGGSIGIDLIGDNLDRQLILEASYLTPHGGKNLAVPGDQFAVGARYQFPISNWSLLRFDTMYGWLDGLPDVYGTRMEYRWKF